MHGARLALQDGARSDGIFLDQVAELEQDRAWQYLVGPGSSLGGRTLIGDGHRRLASVTCDRPDRPVHRMPAREQVLCGLPGQRRLVGPALVGSPAAPGGEPASRRRPGQVGRQARDVQQPLGGVLAQPRYRGQQRLCIWVMHALEQVVGLRRLDDAPRVHHVDPVSVPGDDAHIVRDQQHRHAEPRFQVIEQLEYLRLDGDVERRRRFVRYQQLGLAGQRHRDHDALPQAAGQLVRVVVQPLRRLRQADQVEHLGGPFECLGPARAAMQPDRLGHLVADRLGRVERGQRILEDHRDLVAPDLAQLGVGKADQFPVAQPDRAADDVPARRQQAHDRQARHRLAAARLAHQP